MCGSNSPWAWPSWPCSSWPSSLCSSSCPCSSWPSSLCSSLCSSSWPWSSWSSSFLAWSSWSSSLWPWSSWPSKIFLSLNFKISNPLICNNSIFSAFLAIDPSGFSRKFSKSSPTQKTISASWSIFAWDGFNANPCGEAYPSTIKSGLPIPSIR